MKAKLLITIALIGLMHNSGSAQSIIQHCTIKWTGVKNFREADSSIQEILFFEGANFLSEYGNLPVSIILLPLKGETLDLAVTSFNAVYSELAPGELSSIPDAGLFKEDLIITSGISIARKVVSAQINIVPFRINSESKKIEKLISCDLLVDPTYAENSSLKSTKTTGTLQSVLSTGSWVKMGVKYNGIYKISYSDLINIGLNPSGIDPRNIRIYGNGGGILPESNAVSRYDDLVENPVQVVGEEDGVFNQNDYILFYGQAPYSWKYDVNKKKFSHLNNYYSDYSYYFITASLGVGKRVQPQTSVTSAANKVVTNFNDYSFYEKDELNLIKSGKVWYGEKFDLKNSYDLNPFSFPDINGDSLCYLEVDVAASSTTPSTFKVYVNNGEAISALVPSISPAFNTDFAMTVNSNRTFYLNTPVTNVRVTYLPSLSSSIGWLNYVELNVVRHLKRSGDQMPFRSISSVGAGNVSDFIVSDCYTTDVIWDVTNIEDIRKQETTFQNGNLQFRLPTDILRNFVHFTGNSFLSVDNYQYVSNQNLHATTSADMIIITAPALISEANRLADIHRLEDNMNVVITTPQAIYNEFSSGAQDITAIRDYIKMIYQRSTVGSELKYVLLFGDGSYDYKDRMPDNTNLVPTFQSMNSLRPTESYVSDDYFGLMDSNEGNDCSGTLDIGIGRLPVKTIDEAKAAVDKIVRYKEKNDNSSVGCNTFSTNVKRLGDWRNLVCFVADDEDNNMHLDQAEDLSTYVDTAFKEYNVDKIYFDAYPQLSTPGGQRYPEVTDAINKRVAKGALIINYTGHGGETGWAHERILEVSDINGWTNEMDLPVFVTATCEFSRFDDPERTSAGEYVFLNPLGGGIALYTTTRLSFSSTNFALNMNYYYSVFTKVNGEYQRMGDVMRHAKTPSNPNIRNFVLLGDPALRIVYPEFKIETSTINGHPVGSVPDTLKAYEMVEITGFLRDDQGNKLTDFNGTLYPTVFDKPAEITTLANDVESHQTTFKLQKNVIYKGKVSVNNGDFAFSFVVPRDIAYKYGKGKISYYAENGETDANGVFEDFIIGGSESNINIIPDSLNPTIDLFMNDSLFEFGGITDENPIILAYINDFSGINTTGNGIGHDIVAVVDGETEKSMVLNDFYEADLNSYQRGSVRYPLFSLTNGLHNLRVKVWDVYNNSSEAYTEFLVVNSGALVLENLLNFPNPFRDQTSFSFQHNHPCCELNVEIKIFNMSGQLVKTINQVVSTDGYNGGPIMWDGSSDNGAPISKGIYLYKLRITTESGESFQKSSKLVVLK